MIRHRSALRLAACLSGLMISLAAGGASRLGAQSFPSSIVPSRWEGEASVGAPLRIGLSILAGPQGSSDPVILMDVPESGVLDLAGSAISIDGDSIRFSMPIRGALVPFVAGIHGNQMVGTANMGAPIPIHLTRVAFPVIPYRIEEITIQHDSIRLASSLYLPTTPGPYPAIVFHHGAFADTRNVWRFWADHFARMGIATLVYDNRGAGKTNGDPHVGFEDLAGDALACVAHLKTDGRIRGTEIGIFSGSQGGWVASIAAARSSDVAFVVMIAGPGDPIARNVLYESESMLRAANFTAADIAKALAAKQRIEARIAAGASDDEIDRSLAEIQGERWVEYIGIPQRGTWRRTWWRQIGAFDPSANWSRVRIPVLVLDGSLDTRVPVADSHAAFAQAFAKAGNSDFSFLVFSGAGHGLQLETRPILAPGVVSALSAWVRNHVTLTPASPLR